MSGKTADNVLAAQNGTSSGSPLQYPADYESTSGQWFILTEYNYSRTSMDSSVTPDPTGNIINLPLPMSLGVNYSMNWNVTSLGAFGAEISNHMGNYVNAVNSLLDGYKSGISGFLDSVDKAKSHLGTDDIIDPLKGALVDAVAGSRLGQTVSLYAGVARNPYVAVIFEGPDLRSFRFEYTFFPKTLAEAKTIKKIHDTLIKGMHPSKDSKISNYLFKYPCLYKPSFTNSEYLFKFKYSVIKNLNIQYHAAGAPIYFNDNSTKIPAFIQFGFDLTEIMVLTKEDF